MSELIVGSFPDCCSMCSGHRVRADEYIVDANGFLYERWGE